MAAIATLITSCVYDSEEDLYENVGCATADISYGQDVLPILESFCYACHSAASNNGNVTLEGHASAKEYIDNNRLLGSIEHTPGFAAMPPNGPKLLDCQIEKIQAWADAGAPNN